MSKSPSIEETPTASDSTAGDEGKSSAPEKVHAAEFVKKVRSGDEVTVVDVRTPAEFEEVHLPGSELLPLDRFDAGSVASRFSGKRVYLMCRSGARGMQAAKKLCSAGHPDVVVVEGGMHGCEEAGAEVRRGKKTMSLERQVRIAAGFLVLLGAVLSLLNPWWIALSGFVGAGLMFAGITDTCGMGMLIAKMPWNR